MHNEITSLKMKDKLEQKRIMRINGEQGHPWLLIVQVQMQSLDHKFPKPLTAGGGSHSFSNYPSQASPTAQLEPMLMRCTSDLS